MGSWRDRLNRGDRTRTNERLAVGVLSAVLALSVLLVGGALAWDKLIFPQRPVALLDGRPITLRAYTDALAYRENVLLAQYEEAQRLVQQPASPGGDDFLRQLAQQRLSAIQGQLAGLSTGLVDELVEEQLVRAEAARRGLTASPEEVDRELKALVGYRDPALTPSPAPTTVPAATPAGAAEGAAAGAAAGATDSATPAPTAAPAGAARRQRDFQTLLREYRRATAGTEAVIRSDVEFDILRRKLDEQLAAAVPTQAEQVHARHILVADDTAMQAVQQRLAAGESFEDLAAELSTDPGSKNRGGDLGWFPRGLMVSAFEEAAFKLQAGQTSEPVKTSFGVHLIRVDERLAGRDVEPEQLQALKNGALSRWLETEKAKHKIDYLLSPEQQEWAARNQRRPSFARA